jgi:heat shock protein HslJ
MIKRSILLVWSTVAVLMSGCGDAGNGSDSNVSGPSAGGASVIGSLSGSEDIGAYLQEDAWNKITLDLEKFEFDRESQPRTYEIEMLFEKNKVTALADCQYITASYRLRDDEITFSRVSAPKPALDLPTCKDFEDAESAVSNFFVYSYDVKTNKQNEVVFEGTDIETSVTLKR